MLTNLKGRLEYHLKNDMRDKIDRYLTLITSTNHSYASIGVGYERGANDHSHELKIKLNESTLRPDFLYKYEYSHKRMTDKALKTQAITVSSNVVNFKSGVDIIRGLYVPINQVEMFIECLNTHQRFSIKTISNHSDYTISVEHPLLPVSFLTF